MGLFMKLHTEVRVRSFVSTADVHLHEHSHQTIRNHLFQTLSTHATEYTSTNSQMLLNSLAKEKSKIYTTL